MDVSPINNRHDLITPFLKSTLHALGEQERVRALNLAKKEGYELESL